jgi:hypothetical protein
MVHNEISTRSSTSTTPNKRQENDDATPSPADGPSIGNINEYSSLEDTLISLVRNGCQCLAIMLYVAVHLLRALLEEVLDALIVPLSGLSIPRLSTLIDNLVELLVSAKIPVSRLSF